MSELAKVRLVVRGRVQGVFYRQSTKETAARLGLRGWVRNQSDGSVALEACGGKNQLEELISWCKKGPPSARVEDVQVQWLETAESLPQTFDIVG